jgi:formate hydrogenlyase subunit 3/multisubunit Na+/H+ antiporter MnhD subunit
MIGSIFNLYPILMLGMCGLPLALAISLLIRSWQPTIIRLVPWSAVPALAALGWMPPDEMVSISWLLLKVHLAVDPTGRIFLFFTSVLWLLAGIYAQSYLASDPRRVKFFFFFLLSMSGNFGLIISHDVASFYVFFALMSFASYGLVVHNGDAEALRAGRIYMVLVVIGEVALFAAFVWQTWSVDSLLLRDFSKVRPNALIVTLILVGFGIKAGALPVHVWLPLAHPAAPTPASAVLSGTMIKAGLLGWLRFLPIGQMAMPQWGAFCIVAGLLAAYYAVAVGLTQRNPKTILAYSSISQMGLMTVGVGLAIGWPQTVPTVLPAIGIYAIHHGLAKGALFLGVGVVAAVEGHRSAYRAAVSGLVLASLALAGAPFTSGAVAKIALKLPLKALQDSWMYSLNLWLPIAAIGTTLLMARFIFIVTMHPSVHGKPRFGVWLSWSLTALLTATVVWLLPACRKAVSESLQPISLWQALWPVAIGLSLSGIVWFKAIRKKCPPVPAIPRGDILLAFSSLYTLLIGMGSLPAKRLPNVMSTVLEYLQCKRITPQAARKHLIWLENRLADWQTACLIFVILTGCLFVWSLT